jgi:hypothetical protein
MQKPIQLSKNIDEYLAASYGFNINYFLKNKNTIEFIRLNIKDTIK